MTPPPTPSKRKEKARFCAERPTEEGSVENLQQTARHVKVRDQKSVFRVDGDATERAERPSSFDAERKRTARRLSNKDKNARKRKRRQSKEFHTVEAQSTTASATQLGKGAKNNRQHKGNLRADFATTSKSPLHRGYLANEERRTRHLEGFNSTPLEEQDETVGMAGTKQHHYRLSNTARLTLLGRTVKDSEQSTTAAVDAISSASRSGHAKGPPPPTKPFPRKKRKHNPQRSHDSRNKNPLNTTARHFNHPPIRNKARHQPTPISKDLQPSIDSTSDSEPDLNHLLAHIAPFQTPVRLLANSIPDSSFKTVSDFLLPSDCTMADLRPVILATIEFLGGMQQEQSALCVQTRAIETQLKKLQSKEEPDYAKMRACEKVLSLTVGLCSDLFLAEYMFRDVLDAESENEAFELEDALAVLRMGVGRLVDEFDAEMAGMPEVLGGEEEDNDGRRGER
jgi:hypothetical protein